MDFQGNYKFYGNANIEKLKELLLRLPDSAWTDDVARVSNSHKQSRNLFLKNDIKPDHLYGKEFTHYEEIKNEAYKIVEQIRYQLPESYLVRLQFVRHLKGEGFKPHRDDFSFTLMNSHRIHIPILASGHFCFSVGGEEKYMQEGEIWEINNTRKHAGINNGDLPRIGMIACFARPILCLKDRAKMFLNLESVAQLDGMLKLRTRLENEEAPLSYGWSGQEISRDARNVKKGIVVGIHYQLKDHDTNEVLSQNLTSEPLQFVYGFKQLPEAFEEILLGKQIGESFLVSVFRERAYGKYHPQLKIKIKENFANTEPIADGLNPKIVGALQALQGEKIDKNYQVLGNQVPILYHLIQEEEGIYLEANHPYAGKNLIFTGSVVSLRILREDEKRYALYQGPTLDSLDAQLCVLRALNLL